MRAIFKRLMGTAPPKSAPVRAEPKPDEVPQSEVPIEKPADEPNQTQES